MGYALVRNVVSPDSIDSLLSHYLRLVHEVTGRAFTDPFGADLVEYFDAHRDEESEIYLRIRDKPWLEEFSRQAGIVAAIRGIVDAPCALFRKIPFRIDMPQWVHELALWHQDYFYVRGNTEVITAWIPLQDVTYLNGCLSVMPRSHLLGPVEHDLQIGKKSVPSSIFGGEMRMVEMRKGDMLIFSALMLHSSNLNLSNSIRYSVQARYTPVGKPIDPAMGGSVQL
ncbi:MAG TPA: phytanoyl-CoA dioxygenase family protein [Vicinamibacterales bacterium]|nr:phytanoyl-CoA dioxygenase family protein [Vicinamibacterales bacterium]